MSRPLVTRWSQRSIAAGAGFLVVWHLAALAGAPSRALVAIALYGFVLQVVFGKAYSLVPSYFGRQYALPRLPAVQVTLSVAGAGLLVAGAWLPATAVSSPIADAAAVADAGAVLWAGGTLAFLAGMGWTLRGNLSGAETATGEANADRRPIDRVANAFVPVALSYLLAGTYATAAPAVGAPALLDGYPPRATHLLAAGFAALLLFAVGFRMFPRFT
ncbi:MAG: hypothetical protein V5A23_08705, partial [Halobacteriales archaeon]